MRATWLVLTLSFPLASCGVVGRPSFTCRAGTHPCGNGCIPTNAVCCDDGTGKTSSYCTNGAAGCVENGADRGCNAVFPSGARAQFCCGTAGSFGSNDCPEGERHCGLLCVPVGEPCCPAGSTTADCPERSWDPSGCNAKEGRVGCGICLATKQCVSCGPGFCCQGGQVCGDTAQCVPGTACTGDFTVGAAGGGGSTELCSKYARACGTSGGIQSLGGYYPKQCSCPSGMIDRGAGKLNELCGLPGTGYDCRYCECSP